MPVFEVVIALLLVGVGLASLARRIGTPYPALVAFVGAVLALVPGAPRVALDPELALALFVAPVLMDAAFDASPRDLRANWRPVASLALGAVALTVITVALVARALVPAMPWAAAIALGAIVAPPDAAAATAVLRQLRPPHRLLVILEGESLFNDASALLIYRLAVGAAVGGAVIGWGVVPLLLAITAGSVVLGLILAPVTLAISKRIDDVATSVVFQFCATFAVWLLAERLHLSAILTMVVYAITVARRAPDQVPARIRIPSYAVWDVAVFVLNVLAFILVGLQLKVVVGEAARGDLRQYLIVAVAVCVATILTRIVWVLAATAVGRLRTARRSAAASSARPGVNLSPRAATVAAWCGMRGTVTLAAALALPTGAGDGQSFPFRDLILFAAFAVVLGTLIVQGMTLRPLLHRLRLVADDEVEREVRFARVEALEAALAVTEAALRTEAVDLLRRRYLLRLHRAQLALAAGNAAASTTRESSDLPSAGTAADAEIVRLAVAAQRRRLSALRADRTIGDDAFHLVEQELDLFELDLEQFLRSVGTPP
jgi:monovalent cation/hydrogen antiporter